MKIFKCHIVTDSEFSYEISVKFVWSTQIKEWIAKSDSSRQLLARGATPTEIDIWKYERY